MIQLYHAPSSYYSMIARYALALGEIPFGSHVMDIHKKKDQLSSDYAALNPRMTVPTLVTASEVLTSSGQILDWVVTQGSSLFVELGHETVVSAWLDRHASYSIEGLTFGTALLRFPLLRFLIPKLLARICVSLERKAQLQPDLAHVFLEKREQNLSRIAFFTEGSLNQKVESLMVEAKNLLATLPAPQGSFLLGAHPSRIDVVAVVFIARLHMIGLQSLLLDRPDLTQWFQGIQETQAFKRADIWTRFSIWRMLRSR